MWPSILSFLPSKYHMTATNWRRQGHHILAQRPPNAVHNVSKCSLSHLETISICPLLHTGAQRHPRLASVTDCQCRAAYIYDSSHAKIMGSFLFLTPSQGCIGTYYWIFLQSSKTFPVAPLGRRAFLLLPRVQEDAPWSFQLVKLQLVNTFYKSLFTCSWLQQVHFFFQSHSEFYVYYHPMRCCELSFSHLPPNTTCITWYMLLMWLSAI